MRVDYKLEVGMSRYFFDVCVALVMNLQRGHVKVVALRLNEISLSRKAVLLDVRNVKV